MRRVKVGVIGSGGIFQGAHLPAYPNIAEVQLAAICDISEEALKAAKRKLEETYQARIQEAEKEGDGETAERLKDDIKELKEYLSFSEMLSREELDLVDICTPTKFHSSIAIEALRNDVNVMCEKPMARTYIECLEVVEAVEDSKKFYQHNENWLYNPIWYNAKKIIESGAIGELQLIFLATAHGGPEWASWFWDLDVAGGGALLDNGVHAITCSWFLCGFDKKPVVVKAAEPYGISIRMKTRFIQGMFRPFEVEDDAHVLIRFEDGDGRWITAHVEGSWAHRDSMETAMIGTNGEIRPENRDEQTYLVVSDAKGGKREFNLGVVKWTRGFAGEIRNMCNCILNNVRPICDERIGAETTAIVQAAYLSQKRGKKPVTLDEFKKYALEIRDREGGRAPDVLLKDLLQGVGKNDFY
ncbi:Gfo/Idh/MocA family oxidoreductase [Candidatus Bathyarchaeota archaeon]|nr:Gfo/Idh/MocA family oxidoreductase [Candidatus Bathyarchaeota archaeon]